MICAVNQAACLLKRQIQSQEREFLKKGGFTENMYRQRTKAPAGGLSDDIGQQQASVL